MRTPRHTSPLTGLPDEPGQERRRARFEQAHPDVEFARPGAMAQASFPHRGKQVTITRPLMGDLLDELDRLYPP